jgi:hypothetical protein
MDRAESPHIEGRSSLPLTLKLVALVIFVPIEFSFFIFGLRFSAVRLLLILSAPSLIVMSVQKFATGNYRFVLSDLFFILTGFWLIFAPANVDGLGPALNHAGPEALEFCVAYLLARVAPARHGDALAFFGLLCPVIAGVALLGLLDPLTGSYVSHDLARKLTGFVGSDLNYWTDNHRLGLLRASGSIEHPILFGFICVVGLIVAAEVRVPSRIFVIIACSIGTIFSFSSAPWQAALLGFCLLAYGRITAQVRFRWAALFALAAVGIATAFTLSDSPVGYIISHLTFDPSSGYYRVWTWDRVTYYVSLSPWHGIGYGTLPDEINHSIDSLWLVLSIHSGYPGAILTFLTLIGAASLPTSGRGVRLTDEETHLGMALGIVILLIVFIGFTVDLWGSAWVFIGLLAGMRAHLGELGRLRQTRGAVENSLAA